MKKIGIYGAAAALAFGLAGNVSAYMIDDVRVGAGDTTFYGGGDHHGKPQWEDVIGNVGKFGIDGANVYLSSGGVLTVEIGTAFAGRAGELFDGNSPTYTRDPKTGATGQGIGYGDLLLNPSWSPNGPAPYLDDNNATGTLWGWGLAFDTDSDRWDGSNSLVADVQLYELTGATNAANAWLTDDYIQNATFRNGQEATIRTGDTAATGVFGTFTVDASNDLATYTIDLSGTDFLSDIQASGEVAMHWGETCGNDTVEGVVSVPEPGTLVSYSASVWLALGWLVEGQGCLQPDDKG